MATFVEKLRAILYSLFRNRQMFTRMRCAQVKTIDADLMEPFVDVRTVGFVVSFRSCRAIQGGFLLLAMLCS